MIICLKDRQAGRQAVTDSTCDGGNSDETMRLDKMLDLQLPQCLMYSISTTAEATAKSLPNASVAETNESYSTDIKRPYSIPQSATREGKPHERLVNGPCGDFNRPKIGL